jgi:hypothetical protein
VHILHAIHKPTPHWGPPSLSVAAKISTQPLKHHVLMLPVSHCGVDSVYFGWLQHWGCEIPRNRVSVAHIIAVDVRDTKYMTDNGQTRETQNSDPQDRPHLQQSTGSQPAHASLAGSQVCLYDNPGSQTTTFVMLSPSWPGRDHYLTASLIFDHISNSGPTRESPVCSQAVTKDAQLLTRRLQPAQVNATGHSCSLPFLPCEASPCSLPSSLCQNQVRAANSLAKLS